MASVGLLFFAACLNAANIMMVRGSQRAQEFAVRTALGAGRSRLFRQLLVEAVALAALACGLALLMTHWASRLVPVLSPVDFPRLDEVSVDLNVVLFTAALGIVAAVAFAGFPAMQMLSSRRNPALSAAAGVAAASRGQRVRKLVVVAQVALALVLLVGAGLLSRSFLNLLAADPGFSRSNVVATELHVWNRFPKPEQQSQFFKDLLARIAALPGVHAAGAASALPFIGEPSIEIDTVYRMEGTAGPPVQAYLTMATPDYFRAMGIPLIEGRVFTEQDAARNDPVALITEGIARRHWGSRSAVGKRIRVQDDDRNPVGDQMFEMTVAGVVGDVQHDSLAGERRDEIFVPLEQRPFGSMMLVARGSGDPSIIANSIRGEALALNPLQSFGAIATIQDLVGRTLVTPRFYLILIGAFALTALALAVAGIYGVVSLSTVQRTREIGLRISLGAVTADILALILRQGLALVASGVVIGLVASFALSRFLSTLLFRVTPTDAATFAGVSLLLIAVGALACYLPARRATKIDPVIAMRVE
jgi:putative ABC transport system permease protein